MVRVLAYAWALPNTLLGLLLALLARVGRGEMRVTHGVIEAHGGALDGLLRRAPFLGNVAALTLGHVVLARDAECLARWRRHELAHVAQYARWGPLFLPAYALSSAWAWARGRHPYLDNWFERDAEARGS